MESDQIKIRGRPQSGPEAGVRPGETLTHINGRPIVDVLDYKFHTYDPG